MSKHGSNHLGQKGTLGGSSHGVRPARVSDSKNQSRNHPCSWFLLHTDHQLDYLLKQTSFPKRLLAAPRIHTLLLPPLHFSPSHMEILKERLTGQTCVNALLCIFSRGGVVWQAGYITGQRGSSSPKIVELSSRRKGCWAIQQ